MAENETLWEENQLDFTETYRISCVYFVLCLLFFALIYNTFILFLKPREFFYLSTWFFYVPVIILFVYSFLRTTQRFFKIQFSQNHLLLQTKLRKYTFFFSDLQLIEIQLGKRREWSIKPKHRPRVYFADTKIVFKIQFASPLITKTISFHARSRASTKEHGNEAPQVARDLRAKFRHKIIYLLVLFPKLLKITDTLEDLLVPKEWQITHCPYCGKEIERKQVPEQICLKCGLSILKIP